MKRAILWCGQIEHDKRLQTGGNNEPQSKKEKRLVESTPETRFPYDDISLQVNGLELAFQAACKLGVHESEIYACLVQPDLRPQGLQTNVRGATRDELERLLHEFANKSTEALLFVAVNHGSSNGLTTAEDVTDPMRDDQDTILTPLLLEKYLQVIDGPQVLVISTCHAGAFLGLGHENRCVLAACAANERYIFPRSDNLFSPFLDELFGAWCECALHDGVPRTTLPLYDAFEKARERMSQVDGLMIPLIAGKTNWPPSNVEAARVQRKRSTPRR
ncbi:MAG TPA: hypothetical protein PK156_05675 [Polyangium sp.]|nr:hypothetical protein [Polyangium sp.]